MNKKIVCGKYVVVDADTIIPSGAIYIEDDTVVRAGPYDKIAPKDTDCEMIGSADHLVIPGLVNAHGHGKGVTDFQRGQLDDTLETWKFRYYPPIDSYYDTLWTGIRLLESGVTTTMHNHNLSNVDDYNQEFADTVEAYLKCGIRLAFAPTLVNQNAFVYGDNTAFVQSLSPKLQDLCHRITERMTRFGVRQYLNAIETLFKQYRSARIEILHGPMSPQWVSEAVLREIKAHDDSNELRIHIHTLQTQLQKLYGHKTMGKSLLRYLFDMGFLGPNVTCGHCVWLDKPDIELLAATHTSVTHHASCNLRVRNGISPVFAMLNAGITVGIGMDDKEFGDDKDFIEEMRMVSKLHRLPSHHLDSDHLKPKDCFRMGTEYGSKVLGFSDRAGTLDPGKQADIALIDLTRISEPVICLDHDIIDLLIYRGRATDVDTVLVAGEVVVENGRHVKIDREDVIHNLKASIPEDYNERFRQNNLLFPELRQKVKEYFASWYPEIGAIEKDPFYHMNNKF